MVPFLMEPTALWPIKVLGGRTVQRCHRQVIRSERTCQAEMCRVSMTSDWRRLRAPDVTLQVTWSIFQEDTDTGRTVPPGRWGAGRPGGGTCRGRQAAGLMETSTAGTMDRNMTSSSDRSADLTYQHTHTHTHLLDVD